MRVFLQDLRYSLRLFRKSPGFALVAVLALAFGIGMNTAIFTLLNAIALRPLPVRDSADVVTVYQMFQSRGGRDVHGSKAFVSYPEYQAYRDRSHVFSGLAAHASAELSLGGAAPRALTGFLVSCNYFTVLAPPLSLGRAFLPSECAAPGAAPVVVLSHKLWQGQFAGDLQIIGKSIVLNRNPHTVIGVAPEGFSGASFLGADVWAPVTMQEQWKQNRHMLNDANLSWLELTGRLKPGISAATARADLAVIAAAMDKETPSRTTTVLVDRATLMNNPEGRTPVLAVGAVILLAVSLVLVIACANLANLLLARALGRRKEIAVRLAVGASRWRLLRQLLTESLLLSLAGSTLGVLAAWGTLRRLIPLLVAKLPPEVGSIVLNPNPDIRIMLYSLALALATGIGFGLVPALQSSRPDLNETLKDSGASTGGHATGKLRGFLLATQVSVSLFLLIAAGLLLRGLQAAQTVDPGFDPQGIVTASFDLKMEGYDDVKAAAFHRILAERLSARAGIAVAFVDSVPWSGSRRDFSVRPEGASASRQAGNASISANYLDLLGVPIVRGRAFEAREIGTALPVTIINESTARAFWPGQDPIGKRVRILKELVDHVVVGVARDIRATGLAQVDPIFLYLPTGPVSPLELSLLARGPAGAGAIATAIRQEVRALDPNVLVRQGLLHENMALYQLPSRIFSTLALALGLGGLLLAALGIYGVMAYAVTQRTREIGIRMTMGAQRGDVLRLILTQAMRPVATGVAVGLAASAGVSHLLTSLLYGISPLDPIVFGGVAFFLAAVALLAGYLPAQRAAHVDPMEALRHW